MKTPTLIFVISIHVFQKLYSLYTENKVSLIYLLLCYQSKSIIVEKLRERILLLVGVDFLSESWRNNSVCFVSTQCLVLVFLTRYWIILNFLPTSWIFLVFLPQNLKIFGDFFPFLSTILKNLAHLAENNCQDLGKKCQKSKNVLDKKTKTPSTGKKDERLKQSVLIENNF